MPWLVALCLLLGACAPPALQRQGWTPAQDPGLIIDQARRDLETLGDLKAAAELTLVQSGQHQFASAALLFKPPDLFRIEVRGPLFVHLFTALLQGDSLVVDDGQGHWRGGPFADGVVSRLLGLDLSGYDLRYALLGLVAPAPLDSLSCPRADHCLAYLAGSPPRRLFLDPRHGFVTGEQLLGPDGEVLLSRMLSEYRQVGNRYLPGKVELRQGGNALVITFRTWEVNTGLDRPAFLRGILLDRLEPLD